MNNQEKELIENLAVLTNLKKEEIDGIIKTKTFKEAQEEIYTILSEIAEKNSRSILKKYCNNCIGDNESLETMVDKISKFSLKINLEIDIDKASYMIKNSKKVNDIIINFIGSDKTYFSLNKLLSYSTVMATFIETYCDINGINIVDDTLDNITTNGLSVYVESIPKEILTKEEETELFLKYQTGDINARNYIMEHNLRWVISIASKFVNNGVDIDDLIQVGNEGLIKAIEKFDVSKGYKFSTYSTWWIRQSIWREIDNSARSIRIPVHVLEKIKAYKKIQANFIKMYGRRATDQEIMDKMNISQEQLKNIKKNIEDAISLDTPVGEVEHGEQTTLGDFVEQSSLPLPEEYAMQNAMKDTINKILGEHSENNSLNIYSNITRREVEVLKLRNGFYGGKIYTLEEISLILKEVLILQEKNCSLDQMNLLLPEMCKQAQKKKDSDKLTRERIRQIEAKALRKLRVNREIRNLAESMGIKVSEFPRYEPFKINDIDYEAEVLTRKKESD